jgi:hypothetical protein
MRRVRSDCTGVCVLRASERRPVAAGEEGFEFLVVLTYDPDSCLVTYERRQSNGTGARHSLGRLSGRTGKHLSSIALPQGTLSFRRRLMLSTVDLGSMRRG